MSDEQKEEFKLFYRAYLAWVSVPERDPFFYSKREMLWDEYVRLRDRFLGHPTPHWPTMARHYFSKNFA